MKGADGMKRLTACLLALLLCPAWAARAEFSFPDMFLPEGQPALRTQTSYRGQDVAIDISSMRVEGTDVYVADIHVSSVTCIQRAFGGGAWKTSSAKVQELARENGAILAMTGDNAHLQPNGWLVGNGEALRETLSPQRDLCLIYRSGEMRTLLAQEADAAALSAQAEDIWQAFCFGPALLDAEGKALSEFNSNVRPANPRSVIGYYEPGHYCFVQADGRRTPSALEPGRTNLGLTLERLAGLMEELGCRAAYNLDGGQSSLMWFDGDVLSSPYKGGRRVGDIVFIGEALTMW